MFICPIYTLYRFVGLCSLFCSVFLVGLAQSDPKADEILSASEGKYRKIGQLTASFQKTLEMRGSERKPITVTGKVKIRKEKFRIELSDQVIVCNGKTLWSYLPEDREVTVSNYTEKDGFSPDRIFRISRKEMKARYEGSDQIGSSATDKLTLFPQAKDTEYFKIELWIDKAKQLPAQLKIWNRNGSVVTYRITAIDTQTTLSEADFQFDSSKYADVEVIDNR
jgi:outer membrane lipoprotein-sorting protein